MHALFNPERTYATLVSWADVVVYMVSRIEGHKELNDTEHRLVGAVLDGADAGARTPVVTVLNDSFCEQNASPLLEARDMALAVPGEIARVEAAIGSRPHATCDGGATVVLREVLNRLEDSR